MNRGERDLDELFHDMAEQTATPEPAEDQVRRRQRAIGGMRALHRRSLDRGWRSRRRRYWIVGIAAASLALGGVALAATGLLPGFYAPAITSQPSRAPADRTRAKTPLLSVAEQSQPAVTAPPASSNLVTNKAVVVQSTPVAATPALKRASELELVNQLFAEAKQARREQRDADALALLQRLLTQHPGSVLAHEASVERFRALARLGRMAEAQRYATSYLARYPNGFAADEARRLTGAKEP